VRNILLLTGKKVVDDGHFVALHHELVDQVTPDKSSAARNQYLLALGIGNVRRLHNVGSRRCW
jgi:hypothetical protein